MLKGQGLRNVSRLIMTDRQTGMDSCTCKQLLRVRKCNGFLLWHTGGGGFKFLPPPRNSEGPPKSCQTQPDCENC